MVKKNKRQQNIKNKLIAAICMLLVSSIMMVSSTYAWFTLSTAPEVTGITTSVGANGNLEMALLPESGLVTDIKSTSSDGTLAWLARNLTWGNLVNLSKDDADYGLDKIVLYPAALNVATWDDAKLNPEMLSSAALLKTPKYGADGRVMDLAGNTVTSTYVIADQNFPQNNLFGVRAVGAASGMTDRQLAYRTARSEANTAMSQAKNFASQSLNTNGAALADIALAHGVNSGATHTEADVEALEAIVADLLGDNDTTGVLEYVENAYLNYIIAFGASKASFAAGMDDTEFKAFQSAVTGAEDVYAAVALFGEGNTYGVTLPDSITDPVALLQATREKVESAQKDLEAITATENIPWSTISVPLYKLADTDAMEINDTPASEVKDNMSNIVNSVAGKGLTVTIATGGGVYADVADHCGDFTASIVIKEVSAGGFTLNDMNARMETKSTVSPVYLSTLSTAVQTAGTPDSVGGQTMPISDMYGYVIDLAFRTNAAESNLLLQTDAVDRIYDTNQNGVVQTDANGNETTTMGGGSTMTFTATTTDFDAEDIEGLMEAIRIVFFNPDDFSVYATAKLDMTSAETGAGGDSVTADIVLYTVEATTDVDYVEAGADETATHIADASAEGGYREATDEEKAAGSATHVKKTTTSDPTESVLTGTNAIITALTQGQAHKVSVLVYLDGENISNEDVAATAATSATGTMNLQFASSATLVPMDYTDLMEQGEQTPASSSSETPSESSGTNE